MFLVQRARVEVCNTDSGSLDVQELSSLLSGMVGKLLAPSEFQCSHLTAEAVPNCSGQAGHLSRVRKFVWRRGVRGFCARGCVWLIAPHCKDQLKVSKSIITASGVMMDFTTPSSREHWRSQTGGISNVHVPSMTALWQSRRSEAPAS